MSVGTAQGYPQLKDQGVIMTAYSRIVNAKYYSETCMPKITNAKFTGEIKNQGDKVIIPQRPTIVTKPYKKGQTIDIQIPEAPPIEFNINRARYWGFSIDSIDEHQAHIVLNDEYVDDGSNNMAVDVETEFFASIYADAHDANQGDKAGAKSKKYNLGKVGDPLVVSKTNAVDILTLVHAVLGEQNATKGKNLWVVIPYWMRYMLVNSELKAANVMGDQQSVQRTGRLGVIDGVEIYTSNLLYDAPSGEGTYIVAGNTDAIAHAAQMTKTETFRIERGFGQGYKGLHVYDWKTVKPEGLMTIYAQPAAS